MTQNTLKLIYGARDVVNAPDIKKTIQKRSLDRQDSDEIRAWLNNHFYRYVIGNFEDECNKQLTSLADVQAFFKFQKIPNWLQKKVTHASSDFSVWWVQPDNSNLLLLERKLVEFLKARMGTSLEGKLMRINCPQALQLWQAEHERIQNRKASGKRHHNPDAVQLILKTEQGDFYELLPSSKNFRAEMAYESQIMRHCLGQFETKKSLTGGYGEQYASSAEQGKLRLFSLRTENNLPKVTISATVTADGKMTIDQVKGKQNRPPIAKYRTAMLDFLNHLTLDDVETPEDLGVMDIIKVPSAWLHVSKVYQEDDLMYIMKYRPESLKQMTFTSPVLQWLALVHCPDALKQQIPASSILPVINRLNRDKNLNK